MTLQMLTHQEESRGADIAKERVKQTRRHREQTILTVEYKHSFHARFGPKTLHLLRTYLDNICPNSLSSGSSYFLETKLPL